MLAEWCVKLGWPDRRAVLDFHALSPRHTPKGQDILEDLLAICCFAVNSLPSKQRDALMENAWLKISCRHGEVGGPIISSTTELILRFWILPIDWGVFFFYMALHQSFSPGSLWRKAGSWFKCSFVVPMTTGVLSFALDPMTFQPKVRGPNMFSICCLHHST